MQREIAVMIPDLSEAFAVLVGEKWMEIRSAEPSEPSGWVVLDMPSNFQRVNVRADAITAVRYRTLPNQQEPTINTPWDK